MLKSAYEFLSFFFVYIHQVYAGLAESIATIISIFTVLRYGIQRNIFYYVLIAGICCTAIALLPDAKWEIIITLTVLGKSMKVVIIHFIINKYV